MTSAPPNVLARLLDADPAKALVMIYINQLVGNGYAKWHISDDGETQLRFNTGETFLLAERVLIRVA